MYISSTVEKFAAIKNVQKLKGYCREDWFQRFWILNGMPLLLFSHKSCYFSVRAEHCTEIYLNLSIQPIFGPYT